MQASYELEGDLWVRSSPLQMPGLLTKILAHLSPSAIFPSLQVSHTWLRLLRTESQLAHLWVAKLWSSYPAHFPATYRTYEKLQASFAQEMRSGTAPTSAYQLLLARHRNELNSRILATMFEPALMGNTALSMLTRRTICINCNRICDSTCKFQLLNKEVFWTQDWLEAFRTEALPNFTSPSRFQGQLRRALSVPSVQWGDQEMTAADLVNYFTENDLLSQMLAASQTLTVADNDWLAQRALSQLRRGDVTSLWPSDCQLLLDRLPHEGTTALVTLFLELLRVIPTSGGKD